MNQKDNDFFLSLSDLVQLFKRSRKKVILYIAFFALLGGVFALSRPVLYLGEATFREKTNSEMDSDDSMSMVRLLGLGDHGSASEAIAWMRSRTLMEKLVDQQGWQAHIKKKQISFPFLARVRDNLIVESAFWRKQKTPSLPNRIEPIKAVAVQYNKEIPQTYTVRLESDGNYQIFQAKNQKVGQGKLGVPFVSDRFQLTLLPNGNLPEKSQDFQLTLLPMVKVCEDLIKQVKVKADTKDKSLLKITFPHSSRCEACSNVNALMEIYLEHIRREHKRVLNEQLVYLENRQEEMNDKLRKVLEEHVTILSADLSTSGFPSSDNAMQFLANLLQKYKNSLFSIDLEVKRLKKFHEEGYAFHDRYRSEDDPYTINATLAEIRNLKQQSDAIELALKSHSVEKNGEDQEFRFAQQLDELQSYQVYAREIKDMQVLLQNRQTPTEPYTILKDPRYMIKTWFARINNTEKGGEPHQLCCANFKTYLSNLEHYFEVHDKILKERLTHQQNPPTELQGIDVKTSQELYVEYCKELGRTEAERHQYEYIIEQMKDSGFEISSLSTVLRDPVSAHMIERASNLVLALKDETNRSVKEQERLKSELSVERGFLDLHLRQTHQLSLLREKLIQDKIRGIQHATLELIQQNISILEKYLEDYIATRIANLEQERQIITQHQEELYREIAAIPSKWVSEKMIHQHVEVSEKLMGEVAKMVEAKNISTNLEVIRSTPVDTAVVPLHPKPPRVILLVVLGAFFGAFVSCCVVFGSAVMNGVRASVDNLTLMQQSVAGKLSATMLLDPAIPLHDADLETLRHLLALLCSNGQDRALLTLLGKGPNYAPHLASLLGMRGMRVLLLPLSFDSASQESGLLQFLQKEVKEPKIIKRNGYDEIAAGGFCRYANELIESEHFATFLTEVKAQYDWVVAYSHTSSTSAEAESLKHSFSRIAISVNQERVHELSNWFIEENKKVTFVVINT